MSKHSETAMRLFEEGYNCSQSLVAAFSDILDLDLHTLLTLSSSFGGGMGRMREVCGALSGMFIVAGLLYGYDDPSSKTDKAEHYARIQALANDFRAKYGTLLCRELLGDAGKDTSPVPTERTPDFYISRPCKHIIGEAAAILDRYIEENPPKN